MSQKSELKFELYLPQSYLYLLSTYLHLLFSFQLFVLGGFSGVEMDDLYVYNIVDKVWSKIEPGDHHCHWNQIQGNLFCSSLGQDFDVLFWVINQLKCCVVTIQNGDFHFWVRYLEFVKYFKKVDK